MALAFKRFMAGFLATLIFHQGVIAALWAAKVIPIAPFSMKLVAPLAIPSILSLAFWGGVWGIFLLWLIDRVPAKLKWLTAIVVGALGPTLVFWFVVTPIKTGATPPQAAFFVFGLLVNAVWGIGTLLIGRMLARRAGHHSLA